MLYVFILLNKQLKITLSKNNNSFSLKIHTQQESNYFIIRLKEVSNFVTPTITIFSKSDFVSRKFKNNLCFYAIIVVLTNKFKFSQNIDNLLG